MEKYNKKIKEIETKFKININIDKNNESIKNEQIINSSFTHSKYNQNIDLYQVETLSTIINSIENNDNKNYNILAFMKIIGKHIINEDKKRNKIKCADFITETSEYFISGGINNKLIFYDNLFFFKKITEKKMKSRINNILEDNNRGVKNIITCTKNGLISLNIMKKIKQIII